MHANKVSRLLAVDQVLALN